MIDLNKEHLAELQAILRLHIPDCQVRAFGSRVIGQSGRFSDLDLVIEGKEELSLNTIVKIKNAFRESNLPFKVDVVDWLAISNNFRGNIKKECITIQKGKGND